MIFLTNIAVRASIGDKGGEKNESSFIAIVDQKGGKIKKKEKIQPFVGPQVDVSCCKSAGTWQSHSWKKIPHQPWVNLEVLGLYSRTFALESQGKRREIAGSGRWPVAKFSQG